MASIDKTGTRLKKIRQAAGYNEQPAFAKLLGVSKNRYNNWEAGVARIPIDIAGRLCALTGVTTDYIYFGVLSAAPLDLAVKLRGKETTDARVPG